VEVAAQRARDQAKEAHDFQIGKARNGTIMI